MYDKAWVASAVVSPVEFSHADDLEQTRSFFQTLRNGKVTLALQPVRLIQNSHEVLYYETLLRQWDPIKADLSSLGYVIPSLERLGLINQLDACVIQTVIQALSQNEDIRLGCNLSPLSLQDSAWWQPVFETLRQQPDLANRLVFEITESACPADTEEASGILQTLRSLGCWVALDDLGTGFNTLDMAWRLQPDIVKLDKSLMQGARDPLAGGRLQRLLEALRPQCRYLVAEGVETEEDLRMSAVAGVHAVQGYFTGRPTVQPDWLSRPLAVESASV